MMTQSLRLAVFITMLFCLSGCVTHVASAVVGMGTAVAGAAIGVTTATGKAAASIVTGGAV